MLSFQLTRWFSLRRMNLGGFDVACGGKVDMFAHFLVFDIRLIKFIFILAKIENI